MMDSDGTDPRRVLDEEGRSLPERIRRRREERGMPAYRLAKLAGISAAYMSLIEKGVKLPSEEVAVALARALGDDTELYRAWVHGARFSDPDATLAGLERLSYSPRQRRRGQTTPDTAAPMRRPSSRLKALMRHSRRAEEEPAEHGESEEDRQTDRELALSEALTSRGHVAGSFELDESMLLGSTDAQDTRTAKTTQGSLGKFLRSVVPVPVLQPGTPPGTPPVKSRSVIDARSIDERMLPHGVDRSSLFAYEADEALLQRVRGTFAGVGDLVVLTRHVARAVRAAPSSERVYAVALPQELAKGESRARPIVLSRASFKGAQLILLPGERSRGGEPSPYDVEIVELDRQGGFDEVVVGVVVLVMRKV